jgi:antitoxin (DNA-binding transcriptional repressor) of toxin-antitoxin stability system
MTTYTVDLDNLDKEEAPLGELVERTLDGAEVVITRGDRPVAKLVRISPSARRFGSAKGLIHIADDFDEPLEDFRDYMS